MRSLKKWGDFAILLNSGLKRQRALLWNSVSAMTIIPGALIGYFWLNTIVGAVPYIRSLSAASFLYIAIADLIPELHRESAMLGSLGQLPLLLAGIATIALLHFGL